MQLLYSTYTLGNISCWDFPRAIPPKIARPACVFYIYWCIHSYLTFSSIVMGSVKSVVEKTREASTWNSDKYYDYGRPFVGMLEGHHLYGEWLDAEAEYEIKLAKSTLHWYILVKKKESRTLPYVTFEVTTSNMTNLIPVTRNIEVCENNATDKDVFKGCLFKICCLADEVVSKMCTYNIFMRNCQNFCNELLMKLGKDESSTTFSPDMTEENYDRTISLDFDVLNRVIPEAKQEENAILTISESPEKGPIVRYSATTVQMEGPEIRRHDSGVCKIFGSEAVVLTDNSCLRISSKPSVNDLQDIFRILGPLEGEWREIGHKLALLPYTLNNNQGLHNMLEKYLEEPSRSWDRLANVIDKFSQVAAQRIIELAKKKS